MVEGPARLPVRRQLGVELRAARTLAGLTQRDLAPRLGVSQSTLVRAERGEALLPRATVLSLLGITDADTVARERVLALTEAAHSETWPWRNGLTPQSGHLEDISAGDEETAVRVRNYCMQWMPGLLQTGEYTRQLMPQVDPSGEIDVAAAVVGRLERQQVLWRPGKRFEFLLEEAVLRWSPAAQVMPAQLDRVLSVATVESVDIAVLPVSREGASGWHPFMLWEPLNGPVFVTLELVHGENITTDPGAVAAYEALWSRLWEAAVHGDEAVELIRRAGVQAD